MYKNDAKEQKEQKLFQDINDMNLSDDCPEEKVVSSFKPSFRCTECCLVPLLTVKENESKVTVNCTNGHYHEMDLNEYLEKGLQKNINNIECSDCGLKHEPKKRFKFCSECVKILCKTCLRRHNNNQITMNHETISLRKMDTFCCLHKNRYTHYCEVCHKNICEDCFYLHNNHQILSLKEIKLSKSEVKEMREAWNKENSIINEVVQMFNNAINSIQKKFDDVIKNKREVLQFKKLIEDIYESKDSNFQIIENMNRLKFNNEHLHLETDMNELDVLFELFKYLNCIDYNIDLPNSAYNQNEQTNNNIMQDESLNSSIREKMKNNDYLDNSGNKNEKFINKSIKSKHFIYEKKNKKLYDNYLRKNEEEKNNENKNKVGIDKNLHKKEYESKNEVYEEVINTNIDKDNKNIRYSKKIIQERINKKIKENDNIDKNKIKDEETSESNTINEGVPVLNENNNIVDEINTNTDSSGRKGNNNEKNNYKIDEIFKYDKKKKNIFKVTEMNEIPRIFDEENNENENDSQNSSKVDENLNINKELNKKNKINSNINSNISISENENEKESNAKTSSSLESDKNKNYRNNKIDKVDKDDNDDNDDEELKNKFNDKFIQAILRDKKKEKEIEKEKEKEREKENEKEKDKINDNLRNKPRNRIRDRSKEKRIKIKRNIQDQSNDNLNKDDMLSNSFDYGYQVSQEKHMNLLSQSNNTINDNDNNDNDNGNSFVSEIPKKKYKILNDINSEKKVNNNNNIINNLKLVNKNHHEEKESDVIEIKQPNMNPEILDEFEDKNEIKKINKIYDENYNNDMNNEDNSIDISNDNISNDISNDNISNDDISLDINGEPKKKKRKRIVKKKKKIRKLNIISDASPIEDTNNQNNLDENNNNDNSVKEKNLKKEKIIKKRIIKKKLHFKENNENDLSPESGINTQRDNEDAITPNQEQELKSPVFFTKNTQNEDDNAQKEDENKNDDETPSPPTLNTAENEVNKEEGEMKKKKKKIIKKTKIIKKRKKKKEDLSKSYDDVSKMNKKAKKKISATDININTHQYRRSNSLDYLKRKSELEGMTKINSMKFENGISCLLDVSKPIFAAGNLIGDIKIIEKQTYKEIQTIKEHNGTINSLFKLHDKSILSSSADRTMKKIRLSNDFLKYTVEFVFNGYDNYIFKGIELFNRKIISCSWDDKLYLWVVGSNKQYINTMKFNENQRVEDILEISKDKFSSVSESEIKIWNSNNMSQLHSIKLPRGILTPNSLCKLNDSILISIFYHTIHIIDLVSFSLISSISMDQGNLSCITKLNDGSFLIAEDINTDSYCIFYLKQYLLEGDELQYISFKKDKFYKSNKNNDKEIRALIQFSDGVIAQGITGEFNGKDSGDIFFYE